MSKARNDNEKKCIEYLESLVWKRFDTKEDLENTLSEHFGTKIELENNSYCDNSISVQEEEYGDMLDFDYSWIGCIDTTKEDDEGNADYDYNEKESVFCDCDIYYAKTRANNRKGIIITEVGYEFN